MLWIRWVKACITSSSFSILINGQPSNWIKASRGVRQGDPLSRYLLILVSQNLTNIVNFAMNKGYVPSFDSWLRANFNHMLFVNDLIIVSRASRAMARSCLFENLW